MLMQFIAEDQAIWIKQDGKEAVLAFSIGWTSFYQDLLL